MARQVQSIQNVKKKDNIFWKALLKTSNYYFKTSNTIHGLNYYARGSIYSKIAWVIIVSSAFLCANVLIFIQYLDYIQSPTRMVVDTMHARITDVMFPTVTICDADFINLKIAQDLIKTLQLPTNMTHDSVYEDIFQLTGFRKNFTYNVSSLQNLQKVADRNRYSIENFMMLLRPQCDKIFVRCRWEGLITSCTELFVQSKTYTGSCCSFNILQYGVKYLKIRSQMFGIGTGLSVVLKPTYHDHAITTDYSSGVKVLIHKNSRYPSDGTTEKLIPIGTEVGLEIKPLETFCSNAVRALPVSDRKCLFSNERKLRFFDEYTNENCLTECRMLNALEYCECLPYYFINPERLTVCDFTKISCLVDNFDRINIQTDDEDFNCDCPGSCKTLYYDVRFNPLPIYNLNITYDEFYSGVNSSYTIVHVYFDSQTYRRLRRDPATNIISLISNLGGIYSLFLGMSLLSLAEAIYFFTFVFYKIYKEIEEENSRVTLFSKRLEKSKIQHFKYNNGDVFEFLQ